MAQLAPATMDFISDIDVTFALLPSLYRHLDTVSSLAFHPVNKSILTGSEDGTMRYWNLEPLLRETRK